MPFMIRIKLENVRRKENTCISYENKKANNAVNKYVAQSLKFATLNNVYLKFKITYSWLITIFVL